MGMEMQAPITTTVATTSIARTAQTPSYMPELVATTSIARTPQTPSYMPELVDAATAAMPVEWNRKGYYKTAPEVQTSVPIDYTLPAGVVDAGTFTGASLNTLAGSLPVQFSPPVEFSAAAEYLPDFQPWQAIEYNAQASFPSG